MDVKLQNAYVEVLLGNFMEVVKQNIMFQAQLEVFKTTTKEVDDLGRKVEDLTKVNLALQSGLSERDNVIANQTGQLSSANSQKTDVSSLRQEKDRLQSAVNDLMRQLKQSKEESLISKSESQNVLITNNNRIEDLTKYINRLEEAVPSSKLKKLKIGDGNQSSSSDIGDDVKDGGSF